MTAPTIKQSLQVPLNLTPERIADDIVAHLFSAYGRRASRLILVQEEGDTKAHVTGASDLGGWRESSVRSVLEKHLATLHAENERLRATVDKLPKCWRLNEAGELVQDEPVVPGMKVWFLGDGDVIHLFDVLGALSPLDVLVLPSPWEDYTITEDWDGVLASRCYSTPEAVEAALAKEGA